ncbi:MAG: hypothetical protein ACHREM_01905 [Polyangiales bacterium]
MRARILASLAFPLLAISCSTDQTTSVAGDAQPEIDAGADADGAVIDTGTDSTIGDLGADVATTDAPSDTRASEGGGDSGTTDAAPLPVTITVINALGVEPGVSIAFQDATGAVIGTATTDSTGTASRVVPTGSQVTAILGSATSASLITITAVEPGDQLLALDTNYAGATASIAAVPAPLPDAGADASLSFAANAGSCATTFATPPASLALSAPCVSAGKFPFLVVAEGASFAPLSFAFQKGNSVLTDGGTTTVSMPDAWSTTTTAQTIAATNVASSGAAPNFLVFSEIADGVPTTTTASYSSADDAGVQSATFTTHVGFADSVLAEADMFAAQAAGASFLAIAQLGPAPTLASTTTFDLSTLLPMITNATVDGTTTPTQPSVALTTGASLASTQGGVVSISWFGSLDGGAAVTGTWTIVVPPTATTVQAPQLPSAASAWAPFGGAGYRTPIALFAQASFWTGYAQFRAQSANLTTGTLNYGQAIVPPLPSPGIVRVTAFGTNPS